jgi:hypothetical protein
MIVIGVEGADQGEEEPSHHHTAPGMSLPYKPSHIVYGYSRRARRIAEAPFGYEVEALVGHLMSYQHAPIHILSARAHPCLIGTRPSSSCEHAPIHSLHNCLQLTSAYPIFSSNKPRRRRVCATVSRLTVRVPLLLAMYCSRCKQQVTCITAKTCNACNLLCPGCNYKRPKSEGKGQCEPCIERDRKRREKGRVIRKTCIEDPSLRRGYCTKCKKIRRTVSFRRLPRPGPDGNEYERSCLSCLKKPKPTAAAPLGAPTATHEAPHAPSIEHDETSASQQRTVGQEECSSSYQVIEETSTAGNTDTTRTVAPTLLSGRLVMLFAWTICPESPNSRMRFLRSSMLLQRRRRSLAHCCNTTKSTSVSTTIIMVVMDSMHRWLLLEKGTFQSNTDSTFQVVQSSNTRTTTPLHKFYVLPQMSFE